mmetsp:Transcript_3022/g.9487  ORF Transcript_3022/g.9487 Transcript_3022/m.9487 type:complete len:94 (+) Transcript_3022:150-431(+)
MRPKEAAGLRVVTSHMIAPTRNQGRAANPKGQEHFRESQVSHQDQEPSPSQPAHEQFSRLRLERDILRLSPLREKIPALDAAQAKSEMVKLER